jgi:hypothetical protein
MLLIFLTVLSLLEQTYLHFKNPFFYNICLLPLDGIWFVLFHHSYQKRSSPFQRENGVILAGFTGPNRPNPFEKTLMNSIKYLSENSDYMWLLMRAQHASTTT